MPEILEEYKDTTTNMRHYGNIQFAQLTVLITINAGIIALLYFPDAQLSFCVKCIFKLIGLVISICFLAIIWSSTYLWSHLIRHAAKLEKSLEFGQYILLPGAPKFEILPGTWALRALCFLPIIFWILTLCCNQNF